MVGTLGIRDVSTGTTYTSSTTSEDINMEDPTIPDEDSGTSSTTLIAVDGETIYDESGASESEIEISSIFDTNLSNLTFNPLDSGANGELSMYGYSPLATNRWPYYNSRNSASGNDFSKIEKGMAYWARYNNNKLQFSSNSDALSESGFIFNDGFELGVASYTGKVFDGWNLISLPEKRSVEVISTIFFKYDNSRDYNLTISKKDNLHKLVLNLDNNSTIEAVKELNLKANEIDIFAVQLNIDEDINHIALFSKNEFVISDERNISQISIPNIDISLETAGRLKSSFVKGAVLDINKTFTAQFEDLKISLNGEDKEISTFNPYSLKSVDGTIRGVELIGKENNLTFVFSKNSFYLENKNYVKRYDHDGTTRPNGFFSLDGNETIFQLTSRRDDINSSLILLQNDRKYEIIKGYGYIIDFVENLKIINGSVTFPNLFQAPKHFKIFSFPKNNNLKYFLSQIFEGYFPTQIISLKSEITDNGKWDSMPISKDLSTWESFNSSYDTLLHTDKRRGYWVKFAPFNQSTSFSIDEAETTIIKSVLHQVSEDNSTITNAIHYTVQIFLSDVSKLTRGYLKIGNSEFEMKPELDGTLFSAEVDYENLYEITDLEDITGVEAFVINENGDEQSISLDLNFSKPEKPISTITLEEVSNDQSLRVFKDDLSKFDEVSDIYLDLCRDFGTSTIYIARADTTDQTLELDQLILSNPIKRSYISLYKSTSKLSTSENGFNETPIKYNDSCEKISDTPVDYEGVRVGESSSQLTLFYKKSSNFVSDTLNFPRVMFVKIDGLVLELRFDSVYENLPFYIVDSGENIYSGKFISELYNDDQSPLTLQPIE
jgi:hypothetical protein